MSSASQMLERDSERDRIHAALDSAAAGRGRVIVVEGIAGIGKTRLVLESRELAKQRGFGRLQATGDQTETTMPWGVVRQMVERSVSRYGGDVRRTILEGPAGTALRALDAASTSGAARAGDAEVVRTLHALWWVAVELSAARPLLITVDDAHWADQPSLRFLGYLARRIADLPIALVVATRPPAMDSGALADLTVSPEVERLLPDTLSAAAVAEFHTPTGTLPSPEVAAAVYEACGGNPFLTGALLDELVSGGYDVAQATTANAIAGLGPVTVSRAMLSRLSAAAQRLAGAAAVLGLAASPALAAQVARVEGDELGPAVEELVRSNVVVGGVDGLVFVHPVIREATVAALGTLVISGMHARAALALHERQAPAEQIAVHLLRAPLGTLVGSPDLLATAADISSAAGDHTTARDYLTRAADERPADPDLARRLALAQLRAGQPAAARPGLLAAAASATTLREKAELSAAASQATRLLHGPEAALDEIVDSLETWPPAAQEPARLILEARLATWRSFLPEQRRRADQHLHQFSDLAGATPEERALLALLAQRGHFRIEPHDRVADVARRALGSGALFDDAARGETLLAWMTATISLISAHAVQEARIEIDRARRRVRRGGAPTDFAMVASTAMVAAWHSGDVAGAEAEGESALAAIEQESMSPEVVSLRATATHFLGFAALERRDLEGARLLLRDYDAACGAVHVVPAIWLLELRSRVSLAGDDPHTALRHLQRLRDEAGAADLDPAGLAWRLPAAIAHSRIGRWDEARDLASEHVGLATRWGAPDKVGEALRVAARFEERPDVRTERLAEAVSVLERSHDRLEHTKAVIDLAETWRTLGRRSEARALLTEVADQADACASRAVLTRLSTALESLGDRPLRRHAPGPDSLTSSERRVASLAVAGRTNRDIAQELIVYHQDRREPPRPRLRQARHHQPP